MTANDLLTAFGPLVPVIGLVLTIWWRVENKIEGASKKAQDALDKLAKHETHAAETFATKAGMQEQTAQLLRAIEGVGNRIDGLHERLDRAFERTARTSRSA